MDIAKQIFTEEAKKLLFDSSEIAKLVKPLGGPQLFFFARSDANPPWLKSEEQFRFKFLAFYDDKKEQILIQAINASLVDVSSKRARPLFKKDFWVSEGKLPTKADMIHEILKMKTQKQDPVEKVRKQFNMGQETKGTIGFREKAKKGKSVRG